jgi:Uma2 family endonuclease
MPDMQVPSPASSEGPDLPAPIVLRGIPWRTYVQICDEPRNDKIRMTYYDGTLELTTPEYFFEVPSLRLGILVREVAKRFGIDYTGARCTTMRLPGDGKRKGHGREPDECFYFAANAHRIVRNETIDLRVDPPPDLWIQVDDRGGRRGRLPLYARLGVPEVWRYNAWKHRMWFGRPEGATCVAIERSHCLPMLTPALALEALALGVGLADSEWEDRLVAWLGNLPAGGPGRERGA